MPTAAEAVTREHIEAYLVELLDLGRAPATVSNRFCALQQAFKFLVDEGEIGASPMARMSRPRVPDQRVGVLSEDDLRALLATCAGRRFEDVRDDAIILLLVDTGVRRAELRGLRVDDLDQDVAIAYGKGSRERVCPFGHKTGLVLEVGVQGLPGARGCRRPVQVDAHASGARRRAHPDLRVPAGTGTHDTGHQGDVRKPSSIARSRTPAIRALLGTSGIALSRPTHPVRGLPRSADTRRRINLAVAAVVAHDRARHHAQLPRAAIYVLG